MRNYKKPEIEITSFDFEDIMTSSGVVNSLLQKGVETGVVNFADLTETVDINIFE